MRRGCPRGRPAAVAHALSAIPRGGGSEVRSALRDRAVGGLGRERGERGERGSAATPAWPLQARQISICCRGFYGLGWSDWVFCWNIRRTFMAILSVRADFCQAQHSILADK
ncbi:unnamed protein product [Bubo scandiacus]